MGRLDAKATVKFDKNSAVANLSVSEVLAAENRPSGSSGQRFKRQ